MGRTRWIAGLGLIAAVAIAVPATGNGDDLMRALGIAKQARTAAKQAQATAKRALRLPDTSFRRGFAAGTVGTSVEDRYVVLPGGPSVRLRVPRSGVIEVVASARFNGDAGSLSLYEDGVQVPGQATFCGPGRGALATSADGAAGVFGTPAAVGIACAGTGAPGPVLFRRPPGMHTYSLRYADACTCVGASFSNRRLWVAPRP